MPMQPQFQALLCWHGLLEAADAAALLAGWEDPHWLICVSPNYKYSWLPFPFQRSRMENYKKTKIVSRTFLLFILPCQRGGLEETEPGQLSQIV